MGGCWLGHDIKKRQAAGSLLLETLLLLVIFEPEDVVDECPR